MIINTRLYQANTIKDVFISDDDIEKITTIKNL